LRRQKKLNAIEGRNEAGMKLRPIGHRSVELRLGLYFQQNTYARVGQGKKFTKK
jgi:hypothetical protein